MTITVLFGGSDFSERTQALLCAFLEGVPDARIHFFSAFDLAAEPCMGCRLCDTMQYESFPCIYHDLDGLWNAISRSDLFVIATPVYFRSFPAPLKAIIDRVQGFYKNRDALPAAGRSGPRPTVLLACAGSPGENGEILRAQLRWALPSLGCALSHVIIANNTDKCRWIGAEVRDKARNLAQTFEILSRFNHIPLINPE